MALDKPTLTFELGLIAGVRDPVGTVGWTDITSWVRPWSTARGRQPTVPPAHFEAGQATLLLDNRDRRFDPTNTSSPYSPNLQPARVRLRIRATYAGTTYGVFCGYVKRWRPKWTAASVSEVQITAVDAIGAPLNLPQLAATMWQTVVRHDKPKVWLRLGESSGTVAADSTPNRLDGQYQGSPVLGVDSALLTDNDKSVGPVANSRVSLPYKDLIAGYPWTLECWFRIAQDRSIQRVILAAYNVPAAPLQQYVQVYVQSTPVDSANAGRIVASVANIIPTRTTVHSSVAVDDDVDHHLVVVFNSSTDFKVWIDGTDRTVADTTTVHSYPNDLVTGYGIGNTPAVAFGDFPWARAAATDRLDEVAIYDYALSSDRISKHYDAGAWPPLLGESSGARVIRLLEEGDWATLTDADVDNGQSSLQMVTSAASLVANLQAVEASEQGALFVDQDGLVVFQERHAVLKPPLSVSQATFGQGAGELPYEAPLEWGNDDAELFNEASGSRAGGKSFTVTDTLSQGEFGERPLAPVDGLLNVDDGEVVDLLRYRVTKYAQPTPTVRTIRLHPGAVPSLYPTLLALGLRSRITVNAAPPGGGPVFSQESHVERIGHDVDDQGDWWAMLDLSAADTTTYLILDDTARGALDAGNRVAF